MALRRPLLLLCLTALAAEHPTGNRTTPPILASVNPVGWFRGTSFEVTVEGLNLAGASQIYFSEPGVTGRVTAIKELPDLPEVRLGENGTPSTIDLGPLPPRHQVTLALEIDAAAPIGPVRFRVLTPLGTTPEGRALIEPYWGEVYDQEPNNDAAYATRFSWPAILNGNIATPGDVDWFQFDAPAGEELQFENGAMRIGSQLQPVVSIHDAAGKLLREFRDGPERVQFSYRFANGGRHYLRIADFARSGRGGNYYRIKAGRFPQVTRLFPFGFARGVRGRIGETPLPREAGDESAVVRPITGGEAAWNTFRLAVGEDPEVVAEPGALLALPITVNGRLKPGETHTFRFSAALNEEIVLETVARRFDSPLDTVVEVRDPQGRPLERATVRAVAETRTTLAERTSTTRGIRLQSWDHLRIGDFVLVGGEIDRVLELPHSPDEDVILDGIGGTRRAFFGTSPEAHAVDKPVYKAEIHPPGAKFPPNGLPVERIYWRNDDGGPGYGKDSYLWFHAPAAGEYTVTVHDLEGQPGDYRLSVRRPRPDFRLNVNPVNPAVPRGGTIPVAVGVFRADGFDGPVDVEIVDLPPGVTATKSTILPKQVVTTVLLSADPAAQLDRAVPFRVRARANGRVKYANPNDPLQLLALMPPPDIVTSTAVREVALQPGGMQEVAVSIVRQNNFGGRVRVQVLGLPEGVRVSAVGLNGINIAENENQRAFVIEAMENAPPWDGPVWFAGQVETRSGSQTVYAAPQAVRLRVGR